MSATETTTNNNNNNNTTTFNMDKQFMWSGCGVCYTGIDTERVTPGCVAERECLCFVQDFCCALGAKDYGVGLVTDADKGEICKVALYWYVS